MGDVLAVVVPLVAIGLAITFAVRANKAVRRRVEAARGADVVVAPILAPITRLRAGRLTLERAAGRLTFETRNETLTVALDEPWSARPFRVRPTASDSFAWWGLDLRQGELRASFSYPRRPRIDDVEGPWSDVEPRGNHRTDEVGEVICDHLAAALTTERSS